MSGVDTDASPFEVIRDLGVDMQWRDSYKPTTLQPAFLGSAVQAQRERRLFRDAQKRTALFLSPDGVKNHTSSGGIDGTDEYGVNAIRGGRNPVFFQRRATEERDDVYRDCLQRSGVDSDTCHIDDPRGQWG